MGTVGLAVETAATASMREEVADAAVAVAGGGDVLVAVADADILELDKVDSSHVCSALLACENDHRKSNADTMIVITSFNVKHFFKWLHPHLSTHSLRKVRKCTKLYNNLLQKNIHHYN